MEYCMKCGKVVCQKRARLFVEPYNHMCNYCRDAELEKLKCYDQAGALNPEALEG